MPNLVNAIGNLKVALLRKHAHARLRRKVVQVAVSAGDGNSRPTGHDARSRDQSFIDGIAQIYRQKRQRAHITHTGKTGLQRFARIHHGSKGALERRVLEIVDFIVAISPRAQMRVAINQSRKNAGVRKTLSARFARALDLFRVG